MLVTQSLKSLCVSIITLSDSRLIKNSGGFRVEEDYKADQILSSKVTFEVAEVAECALYDSS